jgi:hypothetical protein
MDPKVDRRDQGGQAQPLLLLLLLLFLAPRAHRSGLPRRGGAWAGGEALQEGREARGELRWCAESGAARRLGLAAKGGGNGWQGGLGPRRAAAGAAAAGAGGSRSGPRQACDSGAALLIRRGRVFASALSPLSLSPLLLFIHFLLHASLHNITITTNSKRHIIAAVKAAVLPLLSSLACLSAYSAPSLSLSASLSSGRGRDQQPLPDGLLDRLLVGVDPLDALRVRRGSARERLERVLFCDCTPSEVDRVAHDPGVRGEAGSIRCERGRDEA